MNGPVFWYDCLRMHHLTVRPEAKVFCLYETTEENAIWTTAKSSPVFLYCFGFIYCWMYILSVVYCPGIICMYLVAWKSLFGKRKRCLSMAPGPACFRCFPAHIWSKWSAACFYIIHYFSCTSFSLHHYWLWFILMHKLHLEHLNL